MALLGQQVAQVRGHGLARRPAQRRAVGMDLHGQPSGAQLAGRAHFPPAAFVFCATAALIRPSAAFSASPTLTRAFTARSTHFASAGWWRRVKRKVPAFATSTAQKPFAFGSFLDLLMIENRTYRSPHPCGEGGFGQMYRQAGFAPTPVVCKDGFLDLIAGRVQLMFPTPGSVTQHVKNGRLRALAVTSAKPSALLPELPTVAESGIPGYEATPWFGLLAPANAI